MKNSGSRLDLQFKKAALSHAGERIVPKTQAYSRIPLPAPAVLTETIVKAGAIIDRPREGTYQISAVKPDGRERNAQKKKRRVALLF
ncbi:MAG: hypothetical protein J5793_03360 [Clostridia bacterium]|nr:hypothetical protein [Clostridia bacterium]